ncbi:methyl-accepting chemotaxis protein [Psychromonas ossibalaenae]|uniref:methyl-accepting chemotaxis protein n=1 Tax=Psychromonas ossibalaenae TaxID=444922 RepID=UPI00037F9EE0|nr:methyl-accepting chemotaxis protein [Psychromonas ossibalaenae]
MLIKQKLIVNSVVFVVSMLVMLLLINFATSSLQKDMKVSKNISDIETIVLQLRQNEKDFIARTDSKFVDDFNINIAALQESFKTLSENLLSVDISSAEVEQLESSAAEYQQYFSSVVDAQKRIGLDQKSGIYGKLGKAVNEAQAAIGDSTAFLLMMLKIRGEEKDFLLHLDNKYVKRYQETITELESTVSRSYLTSLQKKSISSGLSAYKTAFLALAKEKEVLGYRADQGLQKSMGESAAKLNRLLGALAEKATVASASYVSAINTLTYSIFFIAIISATLITWLLARSILSAITRIKNSIIEVAETNNLTIHASSKSNDELGDMANAFNAMITNFQHLIVSVNQSVATVNNATETLSSNIHQANAGVDAQMQETDMVATAVTEMVATIEEIASNTTDTADKAEQTNRNAGKGKQGVDATIEQIEMLSEKLIESEAVVNELAKDSETIGSVLDVIRGIAEQTNLLALNAAIEAARAGEQGRGFAVVADEVRTLASRTQESTKEIEAIIGSLQSRTASIVTLITECRSEGKESSIQAGEAGRMLEEINNDVVGIMDMTTAIATAIQEQSAVATEVNRHVVSIRDVAETASESAQQNEQMGDQLSEQTTILADEIKRFTI